MERQLRLEDYIAVSDVIQQIGLAYDQMRHDEDLPQLFEPGAEHIYYLSGETFDFSLPQGIATLRKIHERCISTVHAVSPPVIEFEGEAARAISAVVGCHLQKFADGSENSWIAYAHYHDLLHRTEGRWRVRRRITRVSHNVGAIKKGAIVYATKDRNAFQAPV